MARQPDIQYIRYYTAGNAAREVVPLVPLKTAKLPKKKKAKRLVVAFDPISVAAVMMSVMMLVLMAVGISRLHTARENTARMTQYVETLQAENRVLTEKFEAGVDLEEVERTALALGMIPEAQADTVILQIHQQPVEEQPDAWQWLYTFLANLFA